MSLGAWPGLGVWPTWSGGDEYAGTPPSLCGGPGTGGDTLELLWGIQHFPNCFLISDNLAAERTEKRCVLLLYIYILVFIYIYIFQVMKTAKYGDHQGAGDSRGLGLSAGC